MIKILILSSIIFVNAYSVQNIAKVVGGDIAAINAFPYQAALISMKKSGFSICCGSVISSKAVLTAGHCLFNKTSTMVLLGAHRVDENFKATKKMIVKPTNYRIHRQFNRTTLAFDIALIILPSKITFSKSIQPVELPSGFLLTERFSGELATVAGWGLTCDGCGNAKTLRFTQSRVMQNSECSKKLKNPNIPSINQICFSKIGSGSPCLGDSGSPLTIVRKDTVIQIALHSQGNKKCETEFPTIFMRLTKQIVEWITEEVLDA